MALRQIGLFAVVAVGGMIAACASSYGEAPSPGPDGSVTENPTADAEAGAADVDVVDADRSCEDFDAAVPSTNRVPEPFVDLAQSEGVTLDSTDGTALYLHTIAGRAYRVALDAVAATVIGLPDDAGSDHLFQEVVAGDRIYLRESGHLAFADLAMGRVVDLADIGSGGVVAPLDTGVILTEPSQSRVRVLSKDGDTVTTYAGQPGARDLAVTPDHARRFWIARGDESAPVAIISEQHTGENLAVLGTIIPDTTLGNALAADETTLYLAGPIGAISAQPITSTRAAFTGLAPGRSDTRTQAFAAQGGRAYWFSSSESPMFTHADLYSVSRCGGTVAHHVAAGDSTSLVSGMAIVANYIYWVSGTKILRVPK